MSTPTLQSILALNDADFLRWVAEQEQPGPWRHKQSPATELVKRPGDIRFPLQHKGPCLKCGTPARDIPGSFCSIPDPLDRSLAEVVAAKVRIVMPTWWDWPKIEPAAKKVLLASVDRNIPGLIYPFDFLSEWFIWAGDKEKYLCLWLALKEGKVGE